jgi:hypothetical protein
LLGIWKFLTSESIGVRHRLGPECRGKEDVFDFFFEFSGHLKPEIMLIWSVQE